MSKITAGIMGATGYTGIELLRILSAHPKVELRCITSRSEQGKKVSELFPSLNGVCDMAFQSPNQARLSECDVVFVAAPNGVAMTHAAELLSAGCKIIDLSADFRIKDIKIWEKWYGMPHTCPELINEAVYGLPEVHRDSIADARLLANPGCYPTTVQLGFLPLLEHDLIVTESLIADCKSGVSGAGRNADIGLLFSEIADSFKAYSASGHRHLPEIQQGLQALSAKPIEVVFTPHLLPIIRGIHSTLYATLNHKGLNLHVDEISQLYQSRFATEPFVQILESATHPQTRNVKGSNNCQISVHRPQRGKTVTVLVVEDNLVKGAAGQAVQNMNIMFGMPESAGLEAIALVP